MRTLYLVGTGVGEAGMTAAAEAIVQKAEVCFGAPRMLDKATCPQAARLAVYRPELVEAALEGEFASAKTAAVLLSGDVGFYSGAAKLAQQFQAKEGWRVHFEPGISSLIAFAARLQMPWQDVCVVSMHGTSQNIVDAARRNRTTFCLCGQNADEVAGQLSDAGFGALTVHVGENLGLEDERIRHMSAQQLADTKTQSLTVLMIENPGFDARVRTGIEDDAFLREERVPMTKREVRAVAMAAMGIKPDDVCYDIGAGSGSVTVEMALSAYRGRVYGVEIKPEAAKLAKENCRRFGLGNVTILCGGAPAALEGLEKPDVVFIGGSGGELSAIFRLMRNKNPNVRLVVTCVTMETVSDALQAFAQEGLEPDIVQLAATRARKVGGYHMMAAQNPITIFSAGGRVV